MRDYGGGYWRPSGGGGNSPEGVPPFAVSVSSLVFVRFSEGRETAFPNGFLNDSIELNLIDGEGDFYFEITVNRGSFWGDIQVTVQAEGPGVIDFFSTGDIDSGETQAGALVAVDFNVIGTSVITITMTGGGMTTTRILRINVIGS